MEISIRINATLYAEDVARLFQQTSWAAGRTLDDIEHMLENTPLDLSAWDQGQLVGFARVLTDDSYRAFVEDVVVDERYREQGVASALMAALMERLAHVEEVTLRCEPRLMAFYGRFGFVACGDAIPFMARRRD
jgi:predicted GNAT family N-acyltransferase